MNRRLKLAAAREALAFIKDKMVLGLGTGSTAECFIEYLVEKVNKERLDLKVIASSKMTHELAKRGNLTVIDINQVDKIDLVVDGADEIDDQKRMIKGGGGALLREKILAKASEKMVVIVDKTKCVEELGKKAIPIEVAPYGYKFTEKKIEKLGFKCHLRLNPKNIPFITDNNNYILDISLDSFIADPQQIHDRLISVTGVLETGLFFDLNPMVIIAYSSNKVKIID
jgi:ribose 5-phosphate isomerase A